MKDSWSSGTKYEPFIGRWSRLVARDFLSWMSVQSGKRWLDIGCGTGALSGAILERNNPSSVDSIDPSEEYIGYSSASLVDPRIQFHVAGAESLPFKTKSFDAIVSGLVLNFVPDPKKAIHEMKRVLAIDGQIGIYLWDYAGKMELLRYFWNAATALRPAAIPLDEGKRFPLCDPQRLEELFRESGLRNTQVQAIDVVTDFKNFDDYWSPFLGSQGPAPGYAASLDERDFSALREEIRSMLPIKSDGSISLIARAWAVKGKT